MALPPFSALSLTSNVVRFVDFGCKLVSETEDIYKSVSGTTNVNFELDVIHQDLSNLVKTPKAPHPPVSMLNVGSSPDSDIFIIARSCEKVANELLTILNELKVEEGRKHRKWHSFCQALRNLGKQSKISELQDQAEWVPRAEYHATCRYSQVRELNYCLMKFNDLRPY
jgi:hypothetical protein